jgi:hypothetical protein
MAYIGFTLFCGLFSFVYEHYSHGVYSDNMIYFFLFPLLGGVLPYGVLGLINKLHFPGHISMNLYNSGIATLTVGSCFEGVLEIYGTTSSYMSVYWIAGAALTALGTVIYLFSTMFEGQNNQLKMRTSRIG